MITVAAAVATTLKDENASNESGLPDDHPVSRGMKLMAEVFSTPEQATGTPYYAVWGLHGDAPIDRAGCDPNNAKIVGRPVFADGPDVSWEHLEFIAGVCSELFASALAADAHWRPRECAAKQFLGAWNRTGAPHDPSEELRSFVLGPEGSALAGSVGFGSDDGRIRWFRVSFLANFSSAAQGAERDAAHAAFDAFFAGVNARAEALGLRGFAAQHTAEAWALKATAAAMREGVKASVGASLALGFVVMVVFTANVVVALYAIAAIAGVVACLFACMALSGYALDFVETIALTLVVGLAMDYVVHYAHAYATAPFRHRQRRTRYAFGEMGTSVASGALTTAAAAAFLFPTTYDFFAKFGLFIIWAIAFSFAFSNLLFMSLCVALGPEGDVGRLCVCAAPPPPPPASSDHAPRATAEDPAADGGGGGAHLRSPHSSGRGSVAAAAAGSPATPRELQHCITVVVGEAPPPLPLPQQAPSPLPLPQQASALYG